MIAGARLAGGRLLLAWVLLAAPVLADEGVATATLTVRITGVAEARGQLLVSVFTSKAGWPRSAQAAATRAVPAEAPETTLRVEGLPPGPAAVLVVHDLDGNGKLTMAWLPLPHPGEPVGASNGAKGRLGTPSFEDARIELPREGTTACIDLAR